MNKAEFISALRNRLYGLPKEDIERSVDYYSEIIDDRVEDGLTETEAVEAVGSVESVALQILEETSLPELVKVKVKPKRSLKVWEIVLLALGSPIWLSLLAAVALIILSVYIVLWSVVVVLYSAVLSFAVGAIAGVAGLLLFALTGKLVQGVLLLGAGLICAGITVLMFFGVNQITKYIAILCKKILLCIKFCFVGKGEA